MTAYYLIATMLISIGVDPFTDERYEGLYELTEAIDEVCQSELDTETRECILLAASTCWIESRCQMNPRRSSVRSPGACGPFQQIRRYADYPGRPESNLEACVELRTDPIVAVTQWKIKMERYRARHDIDWPARYNGEDTRHIYQTRFWQLYRRFDTELYLLERQENQL